MLGGRHPRRVLRHLPAPRAHRGQIPPVPGERGLRGDRQGGPGRKRPAPSTSSAAIGLSAFIELFRNDFGLKLVTDYVTRFWPIHMSNFPLRTTRLVELGEKTSPTGGVFIESPAASPAMLASLHHRTEARGVRFCGRRHRAYDARAAFSSSSAAGSKRSSATPRRGSTSRTRCGTRTCARSPWDDDRLCDLYLLRMRKSLGTGITRAFKDLTAIGKGGSGEKLSAWTRTFRIRSRSIGILAWSIPIAILYYYSATASSARSSRRSS